VKYYRLLKFTHFPFGNAPADFDKVFNRPSFRGRNWGEFRQKPRGLGDIDVGVGGAFRDCQRQGRGACRRAGSPWMATLDLQATVAEAEASYARRISTQAPKV
jgi:hypothetical protein